MGAGDALRYRRQLLSLKGYFVDRAVTVIALDDRTFQMGEIQPESLVGGNVVLERILPVYGRSRRRSESQKAEMLSVGAPEG